MSSAGHIMDMIQRMKLNRDLQRSKKEQVRDSMAQLFKIKASGHVPDTPFDRPKPDRVIKYFHLFVFITIISIILFFIYIIII